MEVSSNQNRYSGFFHFKDIQSIPHLVEFLKSVSLKGVYALEHMDHTNTTDRHIQWAIVCEQPWTKAMDNLFTSKGRLGKYLVDAKISNVGGKAAKRYGKIDALAKGYDWRSMILYVMKDQDPFDPDSCGSWGDELDLESFAGVYHSRRPEKKQKKEKAKPFTTQLIELWEAEGRPDAHRDIFAMLCRNAMLNKWTYIDGKSINRAATWLHARQDTANFERRMLRQYDDGEFNL